MSKNWVRNKKDRLISDTDSIDSTSSQLSKKDFCFLNSTKIIIELFGTTALGIFYILLGENQAAMFFSFWMISIFGYQLSGCHFNPAITLCMSLRQDSIFKKRKDLAAMYVGSQLLGGILAAWVCQYIVTDIPLVSAPIWSNETHHMHDDNGPKYIPAVISELLGTFFYVTFFMINIDPKEQYSQDNVIICLAIAASYVSSRIMAGGALITGILRHTGNVRFNADTPTDYIGTGPLLNPALAFGQSLIAIQWDYIWIYFMCPLVGGFLSFVFYQYIYVKSVQYLAAENQIDDEQAREDEACDIGSALFGPELDETENKDSINSIPALE